MGVGETKDLGRERREGLYEIRLEQDATARESAERREVCFVLPPPLSQPWMLG